MDRTVLVWKGNIISLLSFLLLLCLYNIYVLNNHSHLPLIGSIDPLCDWFISPCPTTVQGLWKNGSLNESCHIKLFFRLDFLSVLPSRFVGGINCGIQKFAQLVGSDHVWWRNCKSIVQQSILQFWQGKHKTLKLTTCQQTVTMYYTHTWKLSKPKGICSTSSSPERLSSAACNSASFSEISFWAFLISVSALVCKSDNASWRQKLNAK